MLWETSSFGSKCFNQMYPVGFLKVTICQLVIVEEAGWAFLAQRNAVSIRLSLITYLLLEVLTKGRFAP